jgi:acetyl esterase/lipase
MRQKTITSCFLSVTFVLNVLSSYASGQSQALNEEILKKICGTWANIAYSCDKGTPPQKIVLKYDRTFEIYNLASKHSPTDKGDYNILESYSDKKGNTYCKATMKSLYSEESSFELWKLDTSGNTWESKFTFTKNTFAKESELHPDTSAAFHYTIYNRRLDEPVPPIQDSIKIDDHIAYIYSTVNGKPLKVYVFQPKSKRSVHRPPAIAIFHGGGWATGDPEWAFGLARHFSSLGMVSVAVQYRLSDKLSITPIEAMADARAAIRWLRSNATTLGIDPAQIVAYGWSAGGHLAVSAAIFDDTTRSTKISCVPNALVLASPALYLEVDTCPIRLLGARADVSSISPATHVRENMPPTLILEGRHSTVTPIICVGLFYERMLAAGNRCDVQIYERVGHLFTPDSIPDDGYPQPDPKVQAEALKRTDEFLTSLGFFK